MDKLRKHCHRVLEAAHSDDCLSRSVDLALITLIVLNVLAITLESVKSMSAEYGPYFGYFETFSVGVFSIEYVLRIWASVENTTGNSKQPLAIRLRYMLSPMALIDLIAILPYYLSMWFGFDLRFLRALRLLRVFKLTRYFSAMEVLLSVLQEEARSFGAALFVLLVILILASSGIYLFEHEAQPVAFGSIPAAMWWAMSTLTTVGYGDVTPVTVGGKIFGACITVVGIGMVALPAGILASGFSDHLRGRQECYEDLVDEALEDGIVSSEEQQELEITRRELGLSEEDAIRIRGKVARDIGREHRVCPHCKKPISLD